MYGNIPRRGFPYLSGFFFEGGLFKVTAVLGIVLYKVTSTRAQYQIPSSITVQ
jgi:hypothetical protein